MRDLLFIYNPNSGKGMIKKYLDEIIDIFENEGFRTTIYRTKAPLDGKTYVKDNGERYEFVVCSGGDGTLSETVSGVMEIEEGKRPKIGFIPTGSTNDTSKSYNLPSSVHEKNGHVGDGAVPCVVLFLSSILPES